MKFGKFELSPLSDGRFYLDGGAMFGIVPKVLWNRLNPADEMNRIELGLNCLLVQTPAGKVLLDTGIGEKFDEKFREMYCVKKDGNLISTLEQLGIERDEIDFVVNTHLHFDHCGGNTIRAGETNFIPTFPRAKYIVQNQEWYDANHPNERTRASYLRENYIPLEESGQLVLVDGEFEIIPGIKVIKTEGHTRGHQSVLIESEGMKAIYLGDLIPTTSHIKIPYIMGYDLFPLNVMEKKKEILDQASKGHWLLIFEHDPNVIFGYLTEENGKQVLKPAHNLNPNYQISNHNQISTNQSLNTKPFDFKERALQFAKEVIEFLKTLPKTLANIEYSKQLIRASGSVGSNYIEADESLGKRDFLIRICRREAGESAYWLRLLECKNQQSVQKRILLIDEALQLVKIFNSIIERTK